MHNGLSPIETGPAASDCEPGQPLLAVIAYDDVFAGKSAMQMLGKLALNRDAETEIQAVPWSLNILEDPGMQKFATQDVMNADMLIIVTGGEPVVSPSVMRWCEDVIRQLSGKEVAVVSLQGSQKLPHGNGPDFLEVIRSAALKAGLAYFATGIQLGHEVLFQRMQQRADMMTPVLDKILHQQTSLQVTGERN